MALDSSRRTALLDLKLRALVRDHVGRDLDDSTTSDAAVFGRGAAFVDGTTAWVLVDEQPERGLGAALAWASRQPSARELAVIADSGTGVLARRANLFTFPVSVWHAIERVLVPALADRYPDAVEVPVEHQAFRILIEEGGADPVEEHGILVGEVRGLEVCRVVTDADTGEPRLEVGVGAHDREAFLLLHGARPTAEALRDVVDRVAGYRRPGAEPHPLNRLAGERFLRWQVLQEPARVGAAGLRSASPPVVRANLKDPVPCVATGTRADGTPVVVVCSTGIDLELVPFAADARAMLTPEADLVLVVPKRDASPITRSVADVAALPISLVPWSA